jgi:hypothetical protein
VIQTQQKKIGGPEKRFFLAYNLFGPQVIQTQHGTQYLVIANTPAPNSNQKKCISIPNYLNRETYLNSK